MLEIIQKPCAKGNFRIGRGTCKVEGIVIHVAEGTELGTDAWFANSAAKVSAHYLVCKSGKIHQYVVEKDSAFHAGMVDRPTWQLAIHHPGSVNSRTIGIEHEGFAKEDITEVQYQVSVELIRSICTRNGLEVSAETIAGHHSIRFAKSCPGKIDVTKLICMARVDIIKPIT